MPKVRSLLIVIGGFVGLLYVTPASAQFGSQVPRVSYYAAKENFYAGAFRRAERGLVDSVRSGIRYGDRRWIDSICHYSMLGEYYYQLGQHALAQQNHDFALRVFLLNRRWMRRVQFPPALTPTSRPVRARIGWGTRTTFVPELPESMSSFEGKVDQQRTFETGGVVDTAHMRSVDAVEVARCLAVSLRRRSQLLGPVGPYFPLSGQLSSALSGSIVEPGHWTAAWGEVLYGLALIGDGQRSEGAAHLRTGVTVGGFDHPLTGIALLELGRLALRRADYSDAFDLLVQASLAGAEFQQADVVDEAFRLLTDAYLANGKGGIYPAIDAAILWARSEDFFRAQASMLLNAAEVAIYANDAAVAAFLEQAAAIINRGGMAATPLGSRLNYLRALTQYRLGNSVAANQSLSVALTQERSRSLALYQRGLVEQLYAQGRDVLSPRRAERLLSVLLREPTDVEWRTRPLETIAIMTTPRAAAIEVWFDLLIERKDYEKAFFVAELLRRHRFYSTLPFGGRLLALRWLVEGERSMLGRRGIARQTELRGAYPALATNSNAARQSVKRLRELVKAADPDQSRDRNAEMRNLVRVSELQENLIREISLRREPAALVFPPQPDLTAVRKGMRDDQAILMFVTTKNRWHAWFIRKHEENEWSVRSPKAVRNAISGLLRGIGNRGRNDAIPLATTESDAWKQPALKLWQLLVGKLPEGSWEGLEEIVVVPDGVLWYLPFEALQVPKDEFPDADEPQTLIDVVRLRYSPTASLAVADARGHNPNAKTTVVAGQLFPRESSTFAQEMLTKLKDSLPDVDVLGTKTKGGSAYLSTLWDRLIVWDDVEAQHKSPYTWSPAQYDQGKPHSRLADWMEYPWGTPDQLIVPGFHTAAESSLNRKATGYEVFNTICGLMSTGTRTVLLSRWRVGGRTPATAVREFASELPAFSASASWQRAVGLVRLEQLHPNEEPRVAGQGDEAVSADHPFFWAGYMLVDTGATPAPESEPDTTE